MRVGKKKIIVLLCLIFFNSSLFGIDEGQMGIVKNILTKQKELSEKMSQELLAMTEGINVSINTGLLEVDKATFEKNLNALIVGDKNLTLLKLDNEKVLEKLNVVKQKWDTIKKDMELEVVTNKIESYNKIDQQLLQLIADLEHAISLYNAKEEKVVEKKPKSDIRFALSNLVNEVIEIENKKGYVISISGRQTMLSQKIAKEAIFIALNIQADEYRKNILASAALFDKSLNGLLNGDKELKLGVAKNEKVIKQIKVIQGKWATFYDNAKSLATSKKLDTKALKYIIKNNEDLLKESHKLVMYFKQAKDIKSSMNKTAQNALDIADRERMLSQKMLKEKLLIIGGIETKKYKSKIRGTVLLFEHAIHGLLIGDEKRGLIKMDDEKIRVKLKETLEIWNMVRLFYLQPEISDEQLRVIISQNQPLLDKMTEIVDMIESSTEL